MCGRSLDNLIEKLPQVDFCCCGCKLSTGTKIIGWLNLIYGIIGEIALVGMLVGLNIKARDDPKVSDDAREQLLIMSLIGGPILGVILGLMIALALLLLVGAHKNEMRKVRCWLHINLVLFIVGFVFAVLGMVMTLTVNPSEAFGQAFTILINFGISFYLISVVKSFYSEQMAAFQRVSSER